MAATPQQFCLRWNNHQSNIISVFEQLLHSEAFVDVTLAVEGMSIKAHKVVLSACSPYFQAVLGSHPDKHPIIILKDVRYVDMRDLLDFMYRGEVSVDQDNLSGFLRVAESLRIKGLTEVNEKKRLDTPASPFLVSQNMQQGSPTQGVISTTSIVPNNDLCSLKRPPLSPTGSFISSKRKRGRPPKISGEDSEGDSSHGAPTSTPEENSESRLEGECQAVKVEAEEYSKDDTQDEKKTSDGRINETSAGSSWDVQGKDDLRIPKEEPEHNRGSRESPGSADRPTTSSTLEHTMFRSAPAKRPRGRPPRVPRQHQDPSKWLPLLPKPSQNVLDSSVNSMASHQSSNINGQSSLANSSSGISNTGISSLFLPPAISVFRNSMNASSFDVSQNNISCASLPNTKLNYSADAQELSPARFPGGVLPLSVELGVDSDEVIDCSESREDPVPKSQSIQEMNQGVQMGIKVRGLDLLRYGRYDEGVYVCTECEKIQIEKTFKTSYSFQRHAYLYHEGSPKRFPCPVCKKEFSRPDKRKSHLKEKHHMFNLDAADFLTETY